MDPEEPPIRNGHLARIFNMGMNSTYYKENLVYEGDHIVPVTVNVWDCLSFPRGMALE